MVRERSTIAGNLDVSSRWPAGAALSTFLISLLVVGSMFVGSEGGMAPVDTLIVLCTAHVVASLLARRRLDKEIGSALVRMMAASAAFLGVATLSVLVHNGETLALVTDVVSFAYFLVPLALLSPLVSSPRLTWVALAVAGSSLVFAGITISQEAVRGTGLMTNPNMAAVWIGLALLLLVIIREGVPRYLRYPIVILLVGALVATNSYSAMVGILLALAYVLATARYRAIAATFAVAGCAVVVILWDEIMVQLSAPERLVSSQGSRTLIWDAAWQVWLDNPLGIGHGNFVGDQIYGTGIQTHNDYLTALVEEGLLGPLVLLLLGLAIWRSGRRITRAMVIYVAISAMFHNVLNFRHVWIFLAIGVALDLWEERRCRANSCATVVREGTPRDV